MSMQRVGGEVQPEKQVRGLTTHKCDSWLLEGQSRERTRMRTKSRAEGRVHLVGPPISSTTCCSKPLKGRGPNSMSQTQEDTGHNLILESGMNLNFFTSQ